MPDPVWCPAEVSHTEWLVRRELTQYPRSWRERHGEELVTTTIDVLDAEEFSGRRLPISTDRECDGAGRGRP